MNTARTTTAAGAVEQYRHPRMSGWAQGRPGTGWARYMRYRLLHERKALRGDMARALSDMARAEDAVTRRELDVLARGSDRLWAARGGRTGGAA